ncbi:hypothetical protein TTHERM_00678150 (macronuclear) [Tetrahymena thermophila SB210]|uniref:Uncharacterized protein n=1 Tax=Tetrahymena thermophila (strain SB210) TaxID=312017 RepID=I7LY28_TETTS|nr:hypothetical protein TTHERM_00678150 [Tetrahymena thermophila SB210]EAS07549.2 hypothetical protein TTHERM_00678150 [Tetrahymena thermophila SB210]|eukprot:XP_001027791.2 hypothetical protein TTHERM_00678150 [Tetrahymena thermophila SB210]
MNEQINEEVNVVEQQIFQNGGQTKQNQQAQVIKKVKKDKNKNQRKNMKNNAQILTEEEKAVNKLMVVSSSKENSLSRQIIEDINKDNHELIQVDLSHSSLKDSNTSCGWDDGFHINYHFCDLKHFCSQMQSLDDLDKMPQKNQNQKESGNDNKNQKDTGKQNNCDNCMHKMRYSPYFQLKKQEIASQDRCRTIYQKQYQQIMQNDQVCQCKDFQQQQNITQNGLVEKSVSTVKSIYFQKSSQFQFSSNKKFIKMLRKQSQNISYQTQQQQKQDNDQEIARITRADMNGEIVQLKDIYRNKKNINVSSYDDDILKQKYDGNFHQFHSNSSERQSLRSQYKAILDYYSIPSPKLSQIKFNPNQLKTTNSNVTSQGQKIKIAVDNQKQQKVSINHVNAENNYCSNKNNIYSSPNFQDSSALQENPFRTIQSTSPLCQKNLNESHPIQRLAPLDVPGEETKSLFNQQNKNINQKLYKTSPLSKHCSSPFDRLDQLQHPQVLKNSFKNIKKIFFKTPDSAISHGSESTLEHSRLQEVKKNDNSSNTSNYETNLPKLNQNYQAQQNNKINPELKNQASQKNLNQRMQKHKLENELLRTTTSDVSDTSLDQPLEQREEVLQKIETQGFQKIFLKEHNQAKNQKKCKDLHNSDDNIANKEKDENKYESVNDRQNNMLKKLSPNKQNGKNELQLQQILEQSHEQVHANKVRFIQKNKQNTEQNRHIDEHKNQKQILSEDSSIKSSNNKNQLVNQRQQIINNQKSIQLNKNAQSGEKESDEGIRETIKINQQNFQNNKRRLALYKCQQKVRVTCKKCKQTKRYLAQQLKSV